MHALLARCCESLARIATSFFRVISVSNGVFRRLPHPELVFGCHDPTGLLDGACLSVGLVVGPSYLLCDLGSLASHLRVGPAPANVLCNLGPLLCSLLRGTTKGVEFGHGGILPIRPVLLKRGALLSLLVARNA
jgi:hypothetical protein